MERINVEAQNEPNKPHEPLPESIQNRTDLDEREKRVLQTVLANETITRAGISDVTGYNMASVKRILAELKKKEILQRDGYSRNEKWIVKK